MNRKLTLIALCVAVIATSSLAVGLKPSAEPAAVVASSPAPAAATTATAATNQASAALVSTQADRETKGQPPASQVPQYIIYRQLFRHVVTLRQKADEEQRQGRDGAALRSLYKRNAKLNDAEAAILEQVAEEGDRRVAEFDEQAKRIIAEARAKHPRGELQRGETLPPPPAELGALQEQRNLAVLQARERLRASFGEEAFDRFDKFVQRDIAPKIKPVQLGIPRPVTPNNPRQQKQQ